MAYTHTNSKGVTYHLHCREVTRKGDGGITKLYYFAKQPQEGVCDMPEGRVVKENQRTGLPILAKG